ncbi:MAG: putative Ig domain-containing protein, partial [Synergistaceae bacterium]|nr:putative Ig domain-containing protein [Synergistaceae bacterium]
MKKYIASFMVVCLLLMCSSAWADYWNEGHSGTEADPYVIDTNADLVALRDRVNAGSEGGDMWYKLTQSLSLSQYTDWEPIGNSESRAFTGHFDGNGKSILVNIKRDSNAYAGLFCHVKTADDTYAVRNLEVNADAGRGVYGRWIAGIVVKLYSGTIDNCAFKGNLHKTITDELTLSNFNANAGGIVETMTGGEITNCTAEVFIGEVLVDTKDTEYGGGIVAYMTGGSVENCKVERSVLIGYDYVGGIVGYAKCANSEYIKDCTFSGSMTPKSGSYSGGIIGYIEGGYLHNNHVNIQNSSYGLLEGAYTGGIAGRIGEGTVLESCDVSSLATVRGVMSKDLQAAGGIVGLMKTSTVRNNQSYATIDGNIVNMGGVVGKLDAASYTINNNRYSSAEHGIGNNAQGAPSEQGCIKVGASIAITTASPLPDAVVRSPYTTTLATDSTTAVVWNLTNGTSLPAGLELGRSTGQISGTPTTAGEFTFTVKASPATGAPATKEFKLTVQAEGTLAITTTDLPAGTTGTAYSTTLVS